MRKSLVIGLEVHVQLKSSRKMFCHQLTMQGNSEAKENELVDPLVFGMPGALPVLNENAIYNAAKFAWLFNATIPDVCTWDRKNYFYPDSAKAYQLTQNTIGQRIAEGGYVDCSLVREGGKTFKLDHAHLEEDVGKLTHYKHESTVDFNRAGTPLLEIVTKPDFRNSDEVIMFLETLIAGLTYHEISYCRMNRGELRCDVNISVRENEDSPFNNRVEIKNLNSFESIVDVIKYEHHRQANMMDRGEVVQQETRGWNTLDKHTYLLRSKENAEDYRYMPDPDIMPYNMSKIKQSLMCNDIQKIYAVKDLLLCRGLPRDYLKAFIENPAHIRTYERIMMAAETKGHIHTITIANCIINQIKIDSRELMFDVIVDTLLLLDKKEISFENATKMVNMIGSDFKWERAKDAIKALGYEQNNNLTDIEVLVDILSGLEDFKKAMAVYHSSKEAKILNPLIGSIVKANKGINPVLVRDTILKHYNENYAISN